jgi:superfamily I DNA/RNA helicase
LKEDLTAEQREIINAKDDFMAITAFAGTGKTSTLKAYAAKRPGARLLYLAFNKALAEEARIAFAPLRNVDVRTIHSLAYGYTGREYQRVLGNYRVLDLKERLSAQINGATFGLAKIIYDALNAWMLSNAPTPTVFLKKYAKSIRESLEEQEITKKSLSAAFNKIWDDMKDKKFIMPHNGYFKLFQLAKFPLDQYDEILVDEAQDLNDAMIDVIFNFPGRKILVGDPYQQIYGWNGAVNALPKAEKSGAQTYYLTQSFRCPQKVADLANQYLKILGAKKDFCGLTGPPLTPKNDYPPVVIARTNAAIFDFAATNLDQMKIYYQGGFEGYQFEILKDINLLRNQRPELAQDPFIKKFKSLADLEFYVQKAEDTAMKIRLAVEKKYGNKVHEIFDALRRRAAPNEMAADLVITTAHKAKGQEFNQVFLLRDFIELTEVLDRGSRAKPQKEESKPIVSREEFQILYVAITRTFGQLEVPSSYLIEDHMINQFFQLVRQQRVVLI